MNEVIKKFGKQILLLSVGIIIITAILQFILPKYIVLGDYLTVILFGTLTFGLFNLTFKSISGTQKINFINAFMIGSIGKIFILMLYIILYLYIFNSKILYFLIYLVTIYFTFTIIEIVYLLKNVKKK